MMKVIILIVFLALQAGCHTANRISRVAPPKASLEVNVGDYLPETEGTEWDLDELRSLPLYQVEGQRILLYSWTYGLSSAAISDVEIARVVGASIGGGIGFGMIMGSKSHYYESLQENLKGSFEGRFIDWDYDLVKATEMAIESLPVSASTKDKKSHRLLISPYVFVRYDWVGNGTLFLSAYAEIQQKEKSNRVVWNNRYYMKLLDRSELFKESDYSVFGDILDSGIERFVESIVLHASGQYTRKRSEKAKIDVVYRSNLKYWDLDFVGKNGIYDIVEIYDLAAGPNVGCYLILPDSLVYPEEEERSADSRRFRF